MTRTPSGRRAPASWEGEKERGCRRDGDGSLGRRSGNVAGVGRFARCRVDVETRRGLWQVRQPGGQWLAVEVQGRGLDWRGWRTLLSGYVGVRFSKLSYLGDRSHLRRWERESNGVTERPFQYCEYGV